MDKRIIDLKMEINTDWTCPICNGYEFNKERKQEHIAQEIGELKLMVSILCKESRDICEHIYVYESSGLYMYCKKCNKTLFEQ